MTAYPKVWGERAQSIVESAVHMARPDLPRTNSNTDNPWAGMKSNITSGPAKAPPKECGRHAVPTSGPVKAPPPLAKAGPALVIMDWDQWDSQSTGISQLVAIRSDTDRYAA